MGAAKEHRNREGTKIRSAVALGYKAGKDSAPKVVAKGRGDLAKRILGLAEEHGIPVRREPDLLTLLEPIELGDEIPGDAYKAIAEILAFLYRVGKSD